MKQKILAVFLFIIIVGFALTNTIILQNMTNNLTEKVASLSFNDTMVKEKAKELSEEFKNKEKYIGLTVSHDDLTNIEDCFAELNGCLEIGDTESAEIVKYRLISFIEHLRRLVGFNIDTII